MATLSAALHGTRSFILDMESTASSWMAIIDVAATDLNALLTCGQPWSVCAMKPLALRTSIQFETWQSTLLMAWRDSL